MAHIYGFTGQPRSGKSYGVVENIILPCLRLGRTVITNIPMRMEALAADLDCGHLVPLTDEMMNPTEGTIHSQYPGAVWVIDEIWNWWPAGITANAMPKHHMEFFRMFGHSIGPQGIASDIVLISQDLADIPKPIRTIMHYNYYAEKLDALGASDRFTVKVYRMREGARVQPAASVIFGKYDEKVYRYYKSHTQVSDAAPSGINHGVEQRVDGRGNVFKKPVFKVLAVLLLLLPFMIYKVVDYFDSFGDQSAPGAEQHQEPKQRVKPAEQVQEQKTHERVAIVQADEVGQKADGSRKEATQDAQELAVPEMKTSDYWQLTGHIEYEGSQVWLVTSRDRYVRQLPQDACETVDGTLEVRCVIDGSRIVTRWTGYRSNVVAATTGGQIN